MKRIIMILAGVLCVALLALLAVHWFHLSRSKEDYFKLGNRYLKGVPEGLVIVRPSPFSPAVPGGIKSTTVNIEGDDAWRIMGRCVTFRQLIAAAYDRSTARVILPAGAPEGRFDFVVTVASDQREQLQEAIRVKLGYVAKTEYRPETVEAMVVKNGLLPGLTLNTDDSQQGTRFRGGRLYMTHMQPGMLAGRFEQALDFPVVDETRMTNFFDFSMPWDSIIQRQICLPATARNTAAKILGEWGLGLTSMTEDIEMLVVEKVR
jgi:uncharacterized protein (TIGR03435 family)